MDAVAACADCGSGSARTHLDGVPLCDRCADRRVAARTGWPELPAPPAPETFTGPDRRTRRIRFRLWRAPTGVVVEAEEDDTPAMEGYISQLMGAHDADVDVLLDALRERVATEIGRLYLQPAEHHDGWLLAGDEVAGRFVFSGMTSRTRWLSTVAP